MEVNFWEFLDRRWPSERAWITLLLALLIGSLLKMADHDPSLWKVEIFKSVLQAAIITGALNMVLAFHFSANKGDEQKTANTASAFEAIKAAANAGSSEQPGAAGNAADQVVEAAADEARQIKKDAKP